MLRNTAFGVKLPAFGRNVAPSPIGGDLFYPIDQCRTPNHNPCRLELQLAPLVPAATGSIAHTFNEWCPVRSKLPSSLDGFSLSGQDIAGSFRPKSSDRKVPLGASLYEYWVERPLSGLAHA